MSREAAPRFATRADGSRRGVEYAAQAQNRRGDWVPAIPGPLLGLRKKCLGMGCGRKFWTMRGYEGHFALCHILALRGPRE